MIKTIIDEIKILDIYHELDAYLDENFTDEEKEKNWITFLYYITGIQAGRGNTDILLVDALDGLKREIRSDYYYAVLKILSKQIITKNVSGQESLYGPTRMKTDHAPASLIVLENAIITNDGDKADEEINKLLNMADNSQNIIEKLIEIAARSANHFPVVNAIFNAFHELEDDLKEDMVRSLTQYLTATTLSEEYEIAEPINFPDYAHRVQSDQLLPFIHLWMATNNSGLRKKYIERVTSATILNMSKNEKFEIDSKSSDNTDISKVIDNQLKWILEEFGTRIHTIKAVYVVSFLNRWLPDSDKKNIIMAHYIQKILSL